MINAAAGDESAGASTPSSTAAYPAISSAVISGTSTTPESTDIGETSPVWYMITGVAAAQHRMFVLTSRLRCSPALDTTVAAGRREPLSLTPKSRWWNAVPSQTISATSPKLS